MWLTVASEHHKPTFYLYLCDDVRANRSFPKTLFEEGIFKNKITLNCAHKEYSVGMLPNTLALFQFNDF